MSLYYYDVDLSADANYQAGALIDGITVMWPGGSGESFVTLNVMGLSGATSVPEPSVFLMTGSVGFIAFFLRCARRR